MFFFTQFVIIYKVTLTIIWKAVKHNEGTEFHKCALCHYKTWRLTPGVDNSNIINTQRKHMVKHIKEADQENMTIHDIPKDVETDKETGETIYTWKPPLPTSTFTARNGTHYQCMHCPETKIDYGKKGHDKTKRKKRSMMRHLNSHMKIAKCI